jgi:hypothetical protein
MYELKKLERYLRVNLLGPGRPSSYEKRIYRSAVSRRLRNTALVAFISFRCHDSFNFQKNSSLKAFHCLVLSTIQYCESSDFSLAPEITVLNTIQKSSVHIAHCHALYTCTYQVCQTFPNSIYFFSFHVSFCSLFNVSDSITLLDFRISFLL